MAFWNTYAMICNIPCSILFFFHFWGHRDSDGGKLASKIVWRCTPPSSLITILSLLSDQHTHMILKLDWVCNTHSGPTLDFQGRTFYTVLYTKPSGEVRGVIRPLPHLESASCSQVRNRSLKSYAKSRMWCPDHRQNVVGCSNPLGGLGCTVVHWSLTVHSSQAANSGLLTSHIWNRWTQIVCVSISWAVLLL